MGARQRRLEREHEVARETVQVAEVIDERALVALLATELRGTAKRALAIEQLRGGAQLGEQALQDLRVAGRASRDCLHRLLDQLRLVIVEHCNREGLRCGRGERLRGGPRRWCERRPGRLRGGTSRARAW